MHKDVFRCGAEKSFNDLYTSLESCLIQAGANGSFLNDSLKAVLKNGSFFFPFSEILR